MIQHLSATRRRTLQQAAGAALISSSLLLVGCGGSKDGGAPTAPTPAPSGSTAPVPAPSPSPAPPTTPAPAPTPTPVTPSAATPGSANGRAIRIIPFGDSMTEGGEGRNEPGYSYRGELYRALQAATVKVDFIGRKSSVPRGGGDPDHEGYWGEQIGPRTGYDTLSQKVSPMLAASGPVDVIIMAFGWNSALRAADTAASEYAGIVADVQRLAPTARLVLATLTPQPGQTEAQQNAQTPGYAALNAKARELANASTTDNLYLADLATAPFVNADFVDDLHWSQTGAAKVATVLLGTLVQGGVLSNLR